MASYEDTIRQWLSSSNGGEIVNSGASPLTTIDGMVDRISSIKTVDKDRVLSNNVEPSIPIEVPEDDEIVIPTNPTDPYVVHDITLGHSVIIRKYSPENTRNFDQEKGTAANTEEYELTRVEGIQYPLLKVNNTEVDPTMIEYLKIDHTGFVPTIKVIVKDQRGFIKSQDTAGLNNVLTVVIIPAYEGAYKGFSVDFYIDEFVPHADGSITYNGKWKFLPFRQEIMGQVKFPGCLKCELPPQDWPNTWEMLHTIAQKTGLGFASSEECKHLPDRLPRILQSMTYEKFIEEQMKMSGLSEDSVLDCWIDLNGYITLTNLSWVLDYKLSPNQIFTNATVGIHTPHENTFECRCKSVHRVITNFNLMGEPSDLEFMKENFIIETDNSLIRQGIHESTPVMHAIGAYDDANNSIVTESVLAEEKSIDGLQVEEYQTEHMTNVSVQVDPYCTNQQRVIREKFLKLRRAKRYRVRLSRPNFGMIRGITIFVAYFEDDPTLKHKLLSSTENLEHVDRDIYDDIPVDVLRWTTTEGMNVLDFSKSGFYYIDGVTWEYQYSTKTIVQELILIKKGYVSNITNKHTIPRLRDIGDVDPIPLPSPSFEVRAIPQTYRI